MTLTLFSEWTNWVNLSGVRPTRNKFHRAERIRDTVGKGAELRCQSQEDQEFSGSAGPNQLILKMTTEHQTVDHTNKIDHDSIFV